MIGQRGRRGPFVEPRSRCRFGGFVREGFRVLVIQRVWKAIGSGIPSIAVLGGFERREGSKNVE